ncbi:MAG: hypothetical protein U5Q03_12420 [Bacteroidota bacterium]|nr:hypothetical protein [Bacteroidota bacterium]
MFINDDILITQGATLTITGAVAMASDARIMVDKGARLEILGGKVTSACNELWRGIEVWGDKDLTQSPLSNQGVVVLSDGAIIENALIGIAATKFGINDVPDYTYSGGIILAREAEFINNKIATKIYPYQYGNSSYFIQCKFKTNRVLYENENPDCFVELMAGYGISFRGCSFDNSVSYETTWLANRGNGIEATDAQFEVIEECTLQEGGGECLEWENSTFAGLNYGIYATSTGLGGDAPIMDRCIFTGNNTGIYLGAVDESTITNCDFNIKKPLKEGSTMDHWWFVH